MSALPDFTRVSLDLSPTGEALTRTPWRTPSPPTL